VEERNSYTIPKANTDHSKIENYRPITLLPVLGKNFEKILSNRIQIAIGKIIPNHQFGFKTGTSTIHPLIILTANTQCVRKMGKKTAALFMDIKKAFDKVWHSGLIFKLHQARCPTYIIKLIDQFLTKRQIQVKVKNNISEIFTPSQGLPQGSPLSPILYNIFSSDIFNQNQETIDHTNKQTYILQFADDTALISHNTTTNKCVTQLQELTNSTLEWMKKWRILPNPTKTKLILFNHKIKESSPSIALSNTQIGPSRKCKYLGLQIDNKLQFKDHVKNQKKIAINRAGHFRSLTYKNSGISTHTASTIYKMICRPILEYAHTSFINIAQSHLNTIAAAERICLRKITKFRHPNNPLHNLSNHLLYNTTKIEPILSRMKRLSKKFINKESNRTAINHLIHQYQEETVKNKLPTLPLIQYLQTL